MGDLLREHQILEILKKEHVVTVDQLVKMLFISPATARRDLASLQKKGLIARRHGGALHINENGEPSFLERQECFSNEKKLISEKCLPLIKDEDSIFMDGSTTISYLLPLLLKFSNLTIVTNSISTALYFSQKTNFKVILPQGIVQNHFNCIVGSSAIISLLNIKCDLFICSCAAFSPSTGTYENSLEQVEIKKIMNQNAKKTIVLADNSKLGKDCIFKCLEIKNIDYLITNEKPDESILNELESNKIKIL